jgi:hypothetical protein
VGSSAGGVVGSGSGVTTVSAAAALKAKAVVPNKGTAIISTSARASTILPILFIRGSSLFLLGKNIATQQYSRKREEFQ